MAKRTKPTNGTNGTLGQPDLAERLGLMPGSLGFLRRSWIFWPVVLIIGILISLPLVTTYIRPNELGVLRIKFGPNKGIQKKTYKAGLHFLFPGWEMMYRFPRNLQMMQWSKNYRRRYSRRGHRLIPAIRIQTSGGYNVQTDLSIQYRIVDPYKVMTLIGPGSLYEDSALIPRSEKILRLVLGELNAEEFYRGPKRIQKADEARIKLNEDLMEKGITIVSVLIMEFQYNARYQKMIESRKLQDQRVFLQQAKKLATIQRYRKRVITERGHARVREEMARGEKEVAKISSAAELYRRQRQAQGRLLKKLAEAKGLELKNRALEGGGSKYLVAIRMAEVLKGIKMLVLPSDGPNGFNPLDFAQLMKQVDALPTSKVDNARALPKKLELPKMEAPKVSIELPSDLWKKGHDQIALPKILKKAKKQVKKAKFEKVVPVKQPMKKKAQPTSKPSIHVKKVAPPSRTTQAGFGNPGTKKKNQGGGEK